MNKRRRKRRRSRTKESLLLAGVTSIAGILVLIMTVAFLKPAPPPTDGGSSEVRTEQPDSGGSGSVTPDAQLSEDGSATGASSTASGQQSSGVQVTTGNIHSGTSTDGTGSQDTSGQVRSDGSLVQATPDGQNAQTGSTGQDAQTGTQGQVMPGQTSQTGTDGQTSQQGQLLPAQPAQQGTSWQSGQQIQPSGQETGDGIIPGTLLPSDGSANYGTQNQTSSGYNTAGQSGYQGNVSQAAPTAILMSPDNYELVVASAYVNIRNLPSLDSLILSVLAEGGAILRDDNTGGWSRVYYNGRTAYIYSKYLIPIR